MVCLWCVYGVFMLCSVASLVLFQQDMLVFFDIQPYINYLYLALLNYA